MGHESALQNPQIALVGAPNAGKTSLFNALTGIRQKVANYPGVTVERKAGKWTLSDGYAVELIDLPGCYGIEATSLDEKVTIDIIKGDFEGGDRPEAMIVVLDAAKLTQQLIFLLHLLQWNDTVVVALNMMDLAQRDGVQIDPDKLSRELGVPVVPTVAVRKKGLVELRDAATNIGIKAKGIAEKRAETSGAGANETGHYHDNRSQKGAALRTPPISSNKELSPHRHLKNDAQIRQRAKDIANIATIGRSFHHRWTQGADKILLNPFAGPIILFALLFMMFQAVYSWSEAPIDFIDGSFAALGSWVEASLPEGILRNFLTQGVIAGVGAVLVFLPQILILFAFILILEASGYMARAAYIMDRVMAGVGLSGRSFIPLLSSFACAIPGIMATRTIGDERERIVTIMIAPLMTCSARLPVYAIIIGAFIPARTVGFGIGLQGLTLFLLYIGGMFGAMLVAWILRRSVAAGHGSGFIMELPRYQLPRLDALLVALWQRAWVFTRRAGTIIFAATVILWMLLSFPQHEKGMPGNQIDHSVAGRIANMITPAFEPIGFNREIVLALIPAMAAREVAVSALATTYAIAEEDAVTGGPDGDDIDPEYSKEDRSLIAKLQNSWSLPTAIAFLIWFVFAPQCISTIAVTRRETNGWKWPLFMLLYLFALAYIGAGAAYWLAVAMGL